VVDGALDDTESRQPDEQLGAAQWRAAIGQVPLAMGVVVHGARP
jgi:hypothetical protein